MFTEAQRTLVLEAVLDAVKLCVSRGAKESEVVGVAKYVMAAAQEVEAYLGQRSLMGQSKAAEVIFTATVPDGVKVKI